MKHMWDVICVLHPTRHLLAGVITCTWDVRCSGAVGWLLSGAAPVLRGSAVVRGNAGVLCESWLLSGAAPVLCWLTVVRGSAVVVRVAYMLELAASRRECEVPVRVAGISQHLGCNDAAPLARKSHPLYTPCAPHTCHM